MAPLYPHNVYIGNKLSPKKLVDIKTSWPEEYINSVNKKIVSSYESQTYIFIFDDGTEISVTAIEIRKNGDAWDYYIPDPDDPDPQSYLYLNTEVTDVASVPGVNELAEGLPGYYEIVPIPCLCGKVYKPEYAEFVPTWKLFETVIHLNDVEHWTREEIADWLETLDLDLEFK